MELLLLFLFLALGSLVGGLLLTIAVVHVMMQLSKDKALDRSEEVLAIVAPHFFLSIALMVSLTSVPSWVVISIQSAGLVALIVMFAGAVRGSRRRLVAYFTRARLFGVAACIVGLWALAFIAMQLSTHSVEGCLERGLLISPMVSLIVFLFWLSLIPAWTGKVKGIENAPRHEGVWRSNDDGFALDVGDKTHRVELARTHYKEKNVRSGEPCVVFGAPVQADGPFRDTGTLVASHVAAGSWEEYRQSLRDGLRCVHIVALAVLWALAFSAIELMLVAFV